MEIRDAIRNLAGVQPERAILATIDSVDEESLTADCTPLNGDAPLLDISLSIDAEDSGLVCLLPEVGGTALILMTSDTTGNVVHCSAGRLVINGGKNGGLINISDLVSKINAIEKDINDLKKAFSGWTPTPQDGGSALKTAAASWASATITETKVEDLEDKNVTH